MDITVLLAIIGCAIVLYLVAKSGAKKGVHKNFNLSTSEYRLLATDLGGSTKKVRLSFSGVSGDPDAVFEHMKRKKIVVGEHKARNMRGQVKPREYYQVILYIGLAKRRWPSHEIVGLISYNDKTVWVDHDQSVFDALIALRPEAVASIRAKKASNSKPLHKRMSVRFPR